MDPGAPEKPGIEEQNPDMFYGELYACDRCGRTFHKRDLAPDGGLRLCGECLDSPAHLWAVSPYSK